MAEIAWTTPRTWITSEVVSSAHLNTHVRDNIGFLRDMPSCRVYNSAALSIPDNSATVLTFNSERHDADAMHSTGSNTGRITIATAGKYLIGASIAWAANATGRRILELLVNGGSGTVVAQAQQQPTSGGECSQTLSSLWTLAASDYVEARVYQNSGGSLNVSASTSFSPEFWAAMKSG